MSLVCTYPLGYHDDMGQQQQNHMFFRQYYLACLSHASYMIGDRSTGHAVVVDPQRDIGEYLEDAAAEGLSITKVIETHFHADFLSGHLELAAATGATIVYGAHAEGKVAFPVETYSHGQHINLGSVDLEILETPGHTPESISVVIRENGPTSEPYGVLTGDTLFIGDVGRPDLLSSFGSTADDLARDLYHSLHTKLMALPDKTKVFPAHGAGSACGKNLSTETVSTIGEQKVMNYALAPMTVEEFVEVVTEGQTPAPLYFPFAAVRNREARELLDENKPVEMLTLEKAKRAVAAGAVVIDTRDDIDFARGHLRGAVNVGLSGRFAEYVGEVMKPGTPIVLITESGTESEARTRLARIGFDNVVGALEDPIRVFVENPNEVEQSSRLSVDAMAERVAAVRSLQIIDVRNPGETALGMIPGATAIPLPSLLTSLESLDKQAPTVVYCAGGYRSSIASSMLRSHGFSDVSDVLGGYNAWIAGNIPASLPVIDVTATRNDTDSLRLDVREQEEWDDGHVDGAIHIPMSELPARLNEIPADRQVICICRSGNRSGKVTAWLINNGVKAVNMTGGMLEWHKLGYPMTSSSGAPGSVV